MRTSQQIIGKISENLAREYLQQQGLKLVVTNYKCKCGEIDLIMQENETLVFVEVRYRKINDFGDTISSVTKSKQRKIIRSAVCYLLENGLYDQVLCRFDIVGISHDVNDNFQWIKDAFWVKW